MLKLLKKTPLIMLIIIITNLAFTYMRFMEATFLEKNLPSNSPYLASPYLLLIVLLIIFVVSWYLTYLALSDCKQSIKNLEESDTVKASVEHQDKAFVYLRKFFFIQGFTFFFSLVGTEFLVSILEAIGNLFG